MPKSTKEYKLEYKYAELPEEPVKYRKKKKKKAPKKSDHKHHYVPCMYDTGCYITRNGLSFPHIHHGTYCDICGRIGNLYFNFGEDDVDDSTLPVFEINDPWKTRFVDLNGD